MKKNVKKANDKEYQRILDEAEEFALSLDDHEFDFMDEVPEGCEPTSPEDKHET